MMVCVVQNDPKKKNLNTIFFYTRVIPYIISKTYTGVSILRHNVSDFLRRSLFGVFHAFIFFVRFALKASPSRDIILLRIYLSRTHLSSYRYERDTFPFPFLSSCQSTQIRFSALIQHAHTRIKCTHEKVYARTCACVYLYILNARASSAAVYNMFDASL